MMVSVGVLQAHAAVASVLADDGSGGEDKKSGPLGLAVILVLIIICAFLFKSMSKHLRRVREQWPLGPGMQPSGTSAPPRPVSPRTHRSDSATVLPATAVAPTQPKAEDAASNEPVADEAPQSPTAPPDEG
ncbi:MAG: hypothetical protein JO147_06450 [Actinobacteria bacterium]|nr:hypothetical protein [Actinomycetota bacterium]